TLCFFFQAEDGIRDFHVTGVQTCALPILQRGAEGGVRRGPPLPLRRRRGVRVPLRHRAAEPLGLVPSERRRTGQTGRDRVPDGHGEEVMSIVSHMNELFGTLPNGTPVHRWTLQRAGVRVRILSYGGIVQDVEVPDRDGRTGNVVLGFSDLEGYLRYPKPFLGALIGRYANRIAGARFPLDGRTCTLAPNDGPNSLHGGARGFDKRVWAVTPVEHGLRLSLVAED